MQLLSHIPTWVFAVFGLLLFLGWRQARTRVVVPGFVIGVGLAMVAFSLWGVLSAFSGVGSAIAVWALALALTIGAGGRLLAPRGMAHAQAPGRVQVPGSWVPLALMMAIFGLKFMLGYEAAVGTPLVPQSAAGLAVAAALGLISGSFLTRALAVHRFSRAAGVATPHAAAAD